MKVAGEFIALLVLISGVSFAGDEPLYRIEADRNSVLSGEVLTVHGKQRFNSGQLVNLVAKLGDSVIDLAPKNDDMAFLQIPLNTPSGTHSLKLVSHDAGTNAPRVLFETLLSITNAAPKVVATKSQKVSVDDPLSLTGSARLEVAASSPTSLTVSFINDLLEKKYFEKHLEGRKPVAVVAPEFVSIITEEVPRDLSFVITLPESFASAIPASSEARLYRVIAECESIEYYVLPSSYDPITRTLKSSLAPNEWQPDLTDCSEEPSTKIGAQGTVSREIKLAIGTGSSTQTECGAARVEVREPLSSRVELPGGAPLRLC